MTDLHPACPSAFYLISATVIYNDSSLIQKCTCVLTSLEESKEEGKIFCKSWLNDLWARWIKAKLTRNKLLALPCSKQSRPEEFLLLQTALEEKGFRKRLGEGCPTAPSIWDLVTPWLDVSPGRACLCATRTLSCSRLVSQHPSQKAGAELPHLGISAHHPWLKRAATVSTVLNLHASGEGRGIASIIYTIVTLRQNYQTSSSRGSLPYIHKTSLIMYFDRLFFHCT